jgi:hypothetical protein
LVEGEGRGGKRLRKRGGKGKVAPSTAKTFHASQQKRKFV